MILSYEIFDRRKAYHLVDLDEIISMVNIVYCIRDY